MLGFGNDRRGGGQTFRDFLLISIVSGIWRLAAAFVGACWRAYRQSLSLLAGRRLDLCKSHYLALALALGAVGYFFILGGATGLSSRALPDPLISWGLIGIGAVALVSTRFLIRRGCL